MTLLLVVNNSAIVGTIARLSKNKKLITYIACMYKNSSIPSNNTILWHYLGRKYLVLRHENDSTPEVLIEEIWHVHLLMVFLKCNVLLASYS